jgi:hypothetical protein
MKENFKEHSRALAEISEAVRRIELKIDANTPGAYKNPAPDKSDEKYTIKEIMDIFKKEPARLEQPVPEFAVGKSGQSLKSDSAAQEDPAHDSAVDVIEIDAAIEALTRTVEL